MIPFIIKHLETAEDVAFATKLYNDNIAWMRFRASKTIGNDFAACFDVAHDCMINMMKHLDTLKRLNEPKLKAYMAISVDNAALNHVKKHSRVTVMHKPESELNADNNYCLEEEIEKRLSAEMVRDNFYRLQKRDRDMIILKYEVGLSDAEIGEIVGLKADSVRGTLRRSVQKPAKLVNSKDER